MILVRNDWIKNWNPIHRGGKTFLSHVPCCEHAAYGIKWINVDYYGLATGILCPLQS